MCYNSTPQCNITDLDIDTFPGKMVKFQLVAVGQQEGIVPSIAQAELRTDFNFDKLEESQYLQKLDKKCSLVQYTVSSLSNVEYLALTPNNMKTPPFSEDILQKYPRIRSLFTQLEIILKLTNCPLGFELDEKIKVCVCDHSISIHSYNLHCDKQRFLIIRKGHNWVNATFDHLRTNQTQGVIIHNQCPYCKTERINLDLKYPDDQCTHNRSGILVEGANKG